MLDQEAHVSLPRKSSDRRLLDHEEMTRLFRTAVQEEVAAHLAAGHPVFSCGPGDDADELFMHTSDGRSFEVRRRPDGTYQILAEVR